MESVGIIIIVISILLLILFVWGSFFYALFMSLKVFVFSILKFFAKSINNKPVQDETELDIWEPVDRHVPDILFGKGIKHDFPHFFQQTSNVTIKNIESMCEWLLECDYVQDIVQFLKKEHWQHPVEFEQTKKGDCEDSALWVWRKLVELGYQAEFVVGMWVGDTRHSAHAWVVFDDKGERYLFETVIKDRKKMITPLNDIGPSYIPFAAVNGEFKRCAYMGLLHWHQTKR